MTRGKLIRSRWVRWLVLPVLGLLTAHTVWTLALKWQFEKRIAKLRAAGEPVDLGDLRRPKVPDADNAAALWEEAHRWYEGHLRIPAALLMEEPEETWDEDDREAVAEYLSGGDPYIDLLVRAAAKPDMWHDLAWEKGPGMEVPVIRQMQDAMTYLEHRARYTDRAADAPRYLAIMLDLTPKLERSGLIFVIVRWSVESAAASSLRVLARRPAFDAGEARALLDRRFASGDDPAPLRGAFLGERVQGLSIVRRWIDGDSPIRLAEELSGAPPDQIEWTFLDTISASWIARPLAYRDALRILDLMEGNLRLVNVPAREALPLAERLDQQYVGGRANLFSRLFAKLGPQAFRQRLAHQANMRVARVGLALLELRQTTGAWPESLDAVVPLVGEEWVIDPYTGERLQYEPGVRLQAAVPIPEAFKDMPEEYEIAWRFGG